MAESTTSFKPTLGLLDATMLVAGSMIGSGIFIVSADITRNVGSAGWLIAVWLLTGFMTLTAALSYGELSAMFPKAGGQYVYLKESYNKLTGFLYGWSFFSVIQTGTIAAVGVAFCKFAAYFFPVLEMNESDVLFLLGPFKIYPAQFVSIFIIVLLTYINTKGVQGGKMIQTVFTVTKLLSLFGLIVFGFILGANAEVWNTNWTDAWTMKSMTKGTGELSTAIIMPVLGAGALGAIAASMVGSIFSSDAWNNVTFIAGEIKNPQKNIGLSLFLGTLIVTLIYVSANLMYLSVLPLDKIAFAESDRVAVTASNIIFGGIGTYIIAAMIMVSTFGCNNGLILAGARVYYTMAQDGLFFKKAGELNKNAVPEWALWAQCIVASLLCLSGRYGDLLDMVSFIVVIFYVLTIAGIFILRKTRPEIPRPYKAIGYPILPAIYMIMGISFCVLLIIYKPQFTWPGLIITLLGIPLYYIAVRNAKK
ncbi:APC family permease [Sediminibacterium sp.]|uniref:APC family permease n=1 Tax=Sediminibacterium sp. TaxID=1917865 RepID=UPI000BCDD960|nr:amino acid permease [Sediminibacterium sp.]OYY10417.1 MAG: amino acid transporter [Sphingobacteriia bacterium 35-36-14]OYZ54181.1 MAG: amino acid transporter [Sphingobacteriia bacterium 24-36-13]OZA63330.1 MAG: amino acid transporter [Sphingobacteriia bacterium 39-36-14]MDP3392891.1 amino acid permease [Sediminibacterium sp.]MDP3566013.1 amino acid permease [Sediminibacterium sp.]